MTPGNAGGIERLAKLAAAEGDNPMLFLRLGMAQSGEGNHQAAIRSLRRAVRLDPEEPSGGLQLAGALRLDDHSDEANALLDSVRGEAMGAPWIRRQLQLVLQGRPGDADAVLGEVLRANPSTLPSISASSTGSRGTISRPPSVSAGRCSSRRIVRTC